MANKPNNPSLWSRAKSMAKQKFDVYPSAYANGWASKWYKSKGGTWRKAEYGMEVMGDGGTPDNPGFNALPPSVQQKIINNMAKGGEKMPAEIARARFAAAGNLDQMSNYGYAYGGYAPQMMYGGKQYMQQGGEQEQVMQIIQMFAQMNQMDPNELMQRLQELQPEEQQQAIMEMAQVLQQSSAQQQPDMTQAAMAYGGYTTGIFAEGGEPNGGMALGQMTAVADKMSKLRQFVSPEQNLDPWIASKLATMDESADSISDYMMYNPEFQQGMMEEDMMEDDYDEEEMMMMQEMANGGYTVTRSNDRKGKTHKVTGPDGTVKYFGDSKLGQHPKDPERKAAFYARHKKNLDGNPFFRAFARETWKDGGSTFSGNAWYETGGEQEPVQEDYPDFQSFRTDLYRYNAAKQREINKMASEAAGNAFSMNTAGQMPMLSVNPYEALIQAATSVYQNPPEAMQMAQAAQAAATAPPIEYSGVSIVDLLKSVGKASDYNSRKQLAAQLGIDNYYGSAKQNMDLIKKITKNPAVLNDYNPVTSPKGSTRKTSTTNNGMITETIVNPDGTVSTSEERDPVANALAQAMVASRPNQAVIGATDRMYDESNPFTGSATYDDSYMLNKIDQDPSSPGNIRKRKQAQFAENMLMAVGTAFGPGMLGSAIRNFGNFYKYLGASRSLPNMAKGLPNPIKGLPQGASKALPKPAPSNWSTASGMSYEMGGEPYMEQYKRGGINLDPAKKGTFKAQATRMGMGVQEAASTILKAPEGKYTPEMRRKANFAKNFGNRKQMGGPVEGEVLDVTPDQLELLRQQGYEFEIM